MLYLDEMKSTSFRTRGVVHVMSLMNSALTATPSTPGCVMHATASFPAANRPAKSPPSRPRSPACEPSLPALVRSVRS